MTGPPGTPPPSAPNPPPAVPSWNACAIASPIVGIVWLWGLGAIAAVVLGHIALRQIAGSNEQGKGLAIAGLVIGYIGVAVLIAVFFVLRAFFGDYDVTFTW